MVKGQSSIKRLAGEHIQHLPEARMCCRQEVLLQLLFKQKNTTMTRLRVIKSKHTRKDSCADFVAGALLVFVNPNAKFVL